MSDINQNPDYLTGFWKTWIIQSLLETLDSLMVPPSGQNFRRFFGTAIPVYNRW